MSDVRTAQWWVKSAHADAQAWRVQADFYAFQNVVMQALEDQKNAQGKLASIPASEIPRPPIAAGRYSTLPSDNDPAPVANQPTKTFTLPPGEQAPVTEQTSRLTRPVDVSNDWLAETGRGYVTFVLPTEDK